MSGKNRNVVLCTCILPAIFLKVAPEVFAKSDLSYGLSLIFDPYQLGLALTSGYLVGVLIGLRLQKYCKPMPNLLEMELDVTLRNMSPKTPRKRP